MSTWFAHALIESARLCVWLAILAAVFVPLEKMFALRPARIFRADFALDLGLYFLNGLVPALALGFPMAVVVTLSQSVLPAEYFDWVDGLPLWATLGLGFVIGEIGFYWGHRWTHKVKFLWYFHRLHHEPTSLDWLANTRSHPVDLVFTRLCGLVPLYALGLSGRNSPTGNMAALLLILVATAWGFFIHANIRWRLGWFEHLLATPAFHHWHHTRDDHIDRNFASTLPVLDRLFGTLHLPKTWPTAYGVGENSAPAGRAAAPERAPVPQPQE